MDPEPNCAICNQPATVECRCELQSLIIAVQESERRVLSPVWEDIRHWVTSQAQAEIDREFERLKRHRESAISEWITRKGGRLTHAERERLNHDFKKGVDEDWRAAIRKYPEVLDYFYRRVTRAVHSGHAFEGIELRKGHRHTY